MRNIKLNTKLKCGAFLIGLLITTPALAVPLLSAEVTRESQNIGNDGVTHTSVFKERIYRDGKNIWIERVLPAHHEHGKNGHAKDEHKHLDMAEAAQHYFLDGQNKLRLNLVLQEDKTAVNMRDADIDMLGLSDCWACTYSLIDPKMLKTMTVVKQANGTTWYRTKNSKNLVNIEWDNKNNIARKIDIRGLNGQSYNLIKADIQTVDRKAPWTGYSGYMTKDYADFGD